MQQVPFKFEPWAADGHCSDCYNDDNESIEAPWILHTDGRAEGILLCFVHLMTRFAAYIKDASKAYGCEPI